MVPEPLKGSSAEFDIVEMRRGAGLEDADELVLGAVERAHAGVALGPDADVFKLAIGVLAGCEHVLDMAPIDALELDGAIGRKGSKMAEDTGKESSEFFCGHFAGGHGKFPVLDLSEPRDVARDRDVIGRVGKHHLRALLSKQRLVGLGLGGIAANQAVLANSPDTANLASRRSFGERDRLIRAIDQDRIGKAKSSDRLCDLSDLLL
ncbi:hypothetical protein WDM22_09130 [Bradyrhizobium septentrionale]|uniref:Uncharacterized protein n=2 Tax=Bradyrhizobium septentrionale TaxID=1404411 RepID=A0A973W7K6_9BRAD|nr:hypothetical protein [Bradyrhizobium septentrionale]UGY17354.1 hypothetical protein HAP48_0007995 [Bradyrhizobium septentrionale]UGY26097.1 hypothetical protein HU675_0004715 [Bradyrhizobium septentrionale]